jgi:hypothetical protein
VAQVTAGNTRTFSFGVVRDPLTDSERPHPCDPAHALITGATTSKSSQNGRRKLAMSAVWVAGPVLDQGPPD